MKLIFCMQINIKLSYSLILLILMGIVRHAQITQNNKFAKSLISHKSSGELRMKDGGFLCKISIKVFSELMPSFLIIHSVTSRSILVSFEWYGHHKNYTQKSSSNTFSVHISHKKLFMQLMFCMLISMKVFFKFILLFSIGLARDAQTTQGNYQYLFNILRKNLGMKLGT